MSFLASKHLSYKMGKKHRWTQVKASIVSRGVDSSHTTWTQVRLESWIWCLETRLDKIKTILRPDFDLKPWTQKDSNPSGRDMEKHLAANGKLLFMWMYEFLARPTRTASNVNLTHSNVVKRLLLCWCLAYFISEVWEFKFTSITT